MSTVVAAISPTAALGIFTVGVLLIYLEMNRPGKVIPGAVGLLLTLLACARLTSAHPRPVALLILGTGAALLVVDLVAATGRAVTVAATGMLMLGSRMLVRPPVGWMACILCGVALGVLTGALTQVARLARTNKAGKPFRTVVATNL